jgi:iron complex transport system ATP-binding protein
VVLSDVNLAFERGRFISLLGPNGAGKTTLLRTLSRHLPPLAGRVLLNETSLDKAPPFDLAKIMAVVLTEQVSPPLFSVFEFVALGRYPHTGFLGRLTDHDYAVVHNALAAVHAENLTYRQFANLSDGERQKTLVARALAQDPQILLLDEPTAHLDLKHRVEVMSILRDLCRTKGITVVASMHDVDVAAKVSDRVALMKKGFITSWGAPEKALNSKTVADLYDFNGADFSRHLGGIELRSDGRRGQAYVVAGLGSGASVYRLLAKQGFAIATGVMHTNDLDYYVARSLGADCTAQEPMEPVNGSVLTEAAARLDACDLVIDTGFDVGPLNQGNVDLLKTAMHSGKTIFTLRKEGLRELLGTAENGWIVCSDTAELLDALEHHVDQAQHKGGQLNEAV